MRPPRAFYLLAAIATLVLTPALSGQETSLVGLTRTAVAEQLGKPQSTLHRGDREILVYANGDRVELIGEQVVAHHPKFEGAVITRDGARYRASPGGTLALTPADPSVPAASPQLEGTATATEAAPPADNTVADERYQPIAGSQLPATENDLPGVADLDPAKLKENLGFEESAPPPSWAKPVSSIVGMTARFAIMFVILQIALKWVGQPYYVPDILKTSALYVVVRDGMHALGGLGGMWEMIPLFRVDEIVGLIALALLLFKTEVTRSGLTAMKIAFATHMVTLGLMLAVGLVMTFGLAMLY